MPSMNNLTEVPRKDLHVFYALDTSYSMSGGKIESLLPETEYSPEPEAVFDEQVW